MKKPFGIVLNVGGIYVPATIAKNMASIRTINPHTPWNIPTSRGFFTLITPRNRFRHEDFYATQYSIFKKHKKLIAS